MPSRTRTPTTSPINRSRVSPTLIIIILRHSRTAGAAARCGTGTCTPSPSGRPRIAGSLVSGGKSTAQSFIEIAKASSTRLTAKTPVSRALRDESFIEPSERESMPSTTVGGSSENTLKNE